jgi:16S rRNA processing protein RimM
MLLAGHLAKAQGLKGEFLLHQVMDEPDRLLGMEGLVLAPPSMNLEVEHEIQAPARRIQLRAFRWHQDRPCVALEGFSDRTSIEPFKGWALWMPDDQLKKKEDESFRHEWVGCEVFLGGRKVGEVLKLESTPMGYDMVSMRDLRPGRTGIRDIPYIKAWWKLDLANHRLDVDPPEGLLDLEKLPD